MSSFILTVHEQQPHNFSDLTSFLRLVLAFNDFSVSGLYFRFRACTCRPVYSSDMRNSAVLVVQFDTNCFTLFKKQT